MVDVVPGSDVDGAELVVGEDVDDVVLVASALRWPVVDVDAGPLLAVEPNSQPASNPATPTATSKPQPEGEGLDVALSEAGRSGSTMIDVHLTGHLETISHSHFD